MSKPEKTVPAPGNWAFWSYDLYPFLLGGEISNPGPKGSNAWHRGESVYIYGYKSYFTPLFCVGPKDGPALVQEIERLRAAYAADIRKADETREREYAASPFGSLRPRT